MSDDVKPQDDNEQIFEVRSNLGQKMNMLYESTIKVSSLTVSGRNYDYITKSELAGILNVCDDLKYSIDLFSKIAKERMGE